MNQSKDRAYLEHIVDCIQRIQNYTQGDQTRFLNDELVQDAVMRRLQTMSESTQRLSTDLKIQASNIDWRAISGFRNILVHDYLDGLDLNRIWDVIEKYLPELQKTAETLLQNVKQLP